MFVNDKVDSPIHFYSVSEAFGEFLNFAAYPVRTGGKVWPTSEHYFQARKFEDKGYAEQIRKAKSPMIAARLGRSRKVPLLKDWEKVKDSVMHVAVTQKFAQHPELAKLLLSTGERKLVEHTVNDRYWGDGGRWLREEHAGADLDDSSGGTEAEGLKARVPGRPASVVIDSEASEHARTDRGWCLRGISFPSRGRRRVRR